MKEERGSIFWQILLPLCCACIIISLMLFGFSNQIRSSEVLTFETDLKEVASKYSQLVGSDMKSVEIAGITVAHAISSIGDNGSKQDMIQKLLSALTQETVIYSAVYFDQDGNTIDDKGKEDTIRKQDYFVQAVHPSENRYIFLSNDSRINGSAIILLIPVDHEKTTLALYYPVERWMELTKINNEFDQTAFSIIMSPDGKILQPGYIKSPFLEGTNLWNNIDPSMEDKVLSAKVKMNNRGNGCVALEAAEERRTLAYSALGINDWTLVFGINQNFVDQREMAKWNETSQMLYQLMAVIIMCIVVLVVINLTNKMRNAEKSRALQEKIDTDPLTGLNNKLATERKIKEYLLNNSNAKAMMLILDIDNFKKINDTLGHAFGDEVLRTLGKQISSNFRVTDIIGRTGGDEFILLLKDLKDDDSMIREANKLINFFKSFQAGEYVKYSATASIGAAIFPSDGQNFEALYKSADSALYRAKKAGKAQLVFYDNREF